MNTFRTRRTMTISALALAAATTVTGVGLAVTDNSAQAAARSCSASTPASQRPVMRQGDQGSCVVELQRRLVAQGVSVGPSGADGGFGPATTSAVRTFQQRRGLSVDGIVGPITWNALVAGGTGGGAYRTT